MGTEENHYRVAAAPSSPWNGVLLLGCSVSVDFLHQRLEGLWVLHTLKQDSENMQFWTDKTRMYD